MVIWVKILKTEKTIEIQLVRLTEVCGKVLSEKNAYKSVKTALLLLFSFISWAMHDCYCPMLLMLTTKTAVCLQTKAIFYKLYGFQLVF